MSRAIEDKSSPACRIMVVDDEEDVRHLLEREIRDLGYEVVAVADGQAAIAEIEQQPFDIVITDFRMPGMDGIQLTEWIKDESSETDVIIITGYASVDTAAEALRLGAFDYLMKPFGEIELVTSSINRAVGKRALEKRLKARTAELERTNAQLQAEIIERKRAEAAERRLVEEKVVVDEVARIITSTLDIEEVYDRFAAEVKKLVDFDRMSICLWDQHAGVFTMKHTVGQEVPGQDVGDMVSLEGTPTQVAIDTGHTVMLSDTADGQYTTDQRFLKAGLRSMLLVPLTYRGSGIAGMALRSENIGAYGLREQVIVERLAHQIAPAVANAELFEQSKRAEEAQRRWAAESSVMAEIGRVVNSSLDINEVYERLGEEIRKLIPFDRVSLTLVNYESGPLSPTWVVGTDVPGRREGDEFPMAGALAGEVVRKRSPILLEAETEGDVEHRFPLLMPTYNAGLRSFMAVPLIDRDAVIGVLQIRSKERGIYLVFPRSN